MDGRERGAAPKYASTANHAQMSGSQSGKSAQGERRIWLRLCRYNPISLDSRRDCVMSFRAFYTGLYPQCVAQKRLLAEGRWVTAKGSSPEQERSRRLYPSNTPRNRCRASMTHVRQSRPDDVFGFQVKVLKTFSVVSSLLESGQWD